MGNAAGKLTPCLCPASGGGDISQRHDIAIILSNPLHDEGLGHSFCYIPPPPDHHHQFFSGSLTTTAAISSPAAIFKNLSGASLSANTSTPLSTTLLLDDYPSTMDRASSFESSSSFASVPLQPIPRNLINSGPLPLSRYSGSGSGLIERGFLSGPIERGVLSGPIDQQKCNPKLEKIKSKYEFNKWGSIKGIKDSILSTIWGNGKENHKTGYDSIKELESYNNLDSVGKNSNVTNFSCRMSLEEENEVESLNGNGGIGMESENVQWAQGKAGEDRVHIVVSENYGWVFVGIYDGFNGPDAPDFLLSNLSSAVNKELQGLLYHDCRSESELESVSASNQSTISKDSEEEVNDCSRRMSGLDCCSSIDQDEEVNSNVDISMKKKLRNKNSFATNNSIGRQILEIDEKVKEKLKQMSSKIKHSDVLKALSNALRKTEEAYLDIADKMVKENPELSLMGSCVLAMLMMGEDIYLMNVGDSRAVLGQKPASETEFSEEFPHISSLQLTVDHNTYVKEEVQRIRRGHLDDPFAVVNNRVKGSLKVTRAFGAGFLKQPKWNDALLEMFRIDYIGSSPYLTCSPSLHHHKVSPRDRFLILSSDGLYQYFTNEEAVSEVELFMASTPEGDPAQHLIEEVLFRAAKKAGMDFYDLIEIPQGERRRYHDDVSLIVISLEGKIWRSPM
ncbi:probable protein phosphatase 2C 4 [Chenopodium quinoa]|uniref:probable protein phosphatase 2C 4 n=1 Tax=Chenopodium quinoa TaxID=63459 RepID=UPI000B78C01B|nr:probable protein phosphatase 2C 4 [Chenopodium quinoa]